MKKRTARKPRASLKNDRRARVTKATPKITPPQNALKPETVIKVPQSLPSIELPGGRSVAIGRTTPPAEDGYWIRFRRPITGNVGHQETQIHVSPEAMQALHVLTGWYGFKTPDVLALEIEVPASAAIIKNGAIVPDVAKRK